MKSGCAVERVQQQRSPRRRDCLASVVAGVVALAISGCSSPELVTRSQQSSWSGRIALQVEDEHAQSFSALFELEGSEEQGELVLLSPLGNTLGKLQWNAEQATLQTSHQQQTSHSLDALLAQVTGEALPVKAIFNWLRGVESSATGWVADLSALQQGRITAQRLAPRPRAILRIALSR